MSASTGGRAARVLLLLFGLTASTCVFELPLGMQAAPTPRLNGRFAGFPALESLELLLTVDPAEAQQEEELLSEPPVPISLCPDGMVYVEGEYCPTVVHRCVRYLSARRDRCAEFAPTAACYGEGTGLRFCVDKYEFPNRAGQRPAVGMTWEQAVGACADQDKRLCTADEWTFACEGPGRLPYPYGYARDAEACNIDKPYRIPNESAFAREDTRGAEYARLDQREPSGSRPGCVSSVGVSDLTGNVDEWVDNEQGFASRAPYRSGLKGGYWGPVRNRCRPMTVDHNLWHEGYQIGFRCCARARQPDQAGLDPAAQRQLQTPEEAELPVTRPETPPVVTSPQEADGPVLAPALAPAVNDSLPRLPASPADQFRQAPKAHGGQANAGAATGSGARRTARGALWWRRAEENL